MKLLIPSLAIAGALLALPAPAAEPHPSLPRPVIPECLGVNIHFTDPQPGELEMLAAAGFKWVRMDLTWAGTERKKGEYDFSAYDRLVAALDRHKLRALFILDYGHPLYAEPGDTHPFTSRAGTEEFRAAFARWAVAAVRHFMGRGYLWEMWNEPNHDGFWKPKPDVAQYAALARATGEALRAAGLLGAKGEAFIGPATAGIDLQFLEGCFQAGLLEYWDGVSVHPYRQTAPETVVDDYRALRELLAKYAPLEKVIPIISGEWGYSTAYPAFAGKTDAEREAMQARYVAREFLTNVAHGVALSIWYDWRDDGDDPKEAEHRFGLVRRKYHAGREPVFDPKPAYHAVQALQSPAVAALVKIGMLNPDVRETPIRGIRPQPNLFERSDVRVLADGDEKTVSSRALEIVAPGVIASPGGGAPGVSTTLRYSFKAGWGFIRIVNETKIPPLLPDSEIPARQLGIWLHGDGKGCQARVRFTDSSGQTFQADGPKIDWQGWRYVTFPLQASAAAPLTYWGGANDGKIYYPIKWDTIFLLDNVSREPVEGEIYLSAPTLIY